MTVTAATLRGVEAELSALSRSLGDHERTVAAALRAALGGVDSAASSWGGPRATDVLGAGRAYFDEVAEVPAAIASARGSVERLAVAARAAAAALAVQEANLRRASDVSSADPLALVDAALDRVRAHVQIATLAAQWERTAASMAGELSAAVGVIRRSANAGAGRPSGWRSSGPPTAGGPEAVAAWWASLSWMEKALQMITAPGLGNMDGIPAWVRDLANRAQMEADIDRLMLEEHRGTLTAEEAQVLDNARAAKAMLDSHEAFIDPLTLEPVTAQLYIYDPDAFGGDGRIAVAIGDLDTAAHIAVTVPGLLSDAGGLDPDKSENIYFEARHASGESVAVLDWMGYDAPSNSTSDGGAVDQITEALDIAGVVNMSAATDGAEQLASDVAGINAMRGSNDPHLTVVGNSYGSTTAAIAADEFGLEADDLVLSGSPGAGHADDAGDLTTGHDHTWVATASNDFVSYLGETGGYDPADWMADQIPGVEQMGNDPSEDAFGANRMQAEYPERTTDGPLNFPGTIDGHSHYYDAGSESLYNVASVVAGEYDLVEPADPRHKSPFVETHNPVEDVDIGWHWPPIDIDWQMPAEVNQFPVDPEAHRVPSDDAWTHA